METLKIRYLSDKIEKLRFIDGKSDWIDLRSAEEVNMKAGEARLISLGMQCSFQRATRHMLFQEAVHLRISVSSRQIIWV